MRLVVTGREGQVVRSLMERAADTAVEVVSVGRPELDLAGDAAAIGAAIECARPDAIVSAAAYTQVDRAETDQDAAFAINAEGARAVAEAAARLSVPLIHLSTDYVFDGTSPSPYRETDDTGPTGVYGKSKLAGEQAVLEAHGNSVILRTAWVYSPFGANFVKTMLRLAGERDEISVVADQRGNPTSALDIADGILKVASNLHASPSEELRGIFHMTGQGSATWADFAETIFDFSAALGGPSAAVRPIGSADYPTPARRPQNSKLDSSKLEQIHGVTLPVWQASTKDVVQRLVNKR